MADGVSVHSPSIAALPATTVRQLGSTNVLCDPSSVVKELIDNALDARANAVFVDITANTLDSIQVKDTGHGISAEDRALVCRRYCTSKIRDFRDLEDIGGKWLGFRGEALASMAEMSGTLETITRVEGEPVAYKLKYGRDGELTSTEHASAPVGTTVKITNFLQNLPVRKETAIKESTKVLAKIKRLMQSYAFARPSVRFSLRVLKAKSNKGDFTYAPKKDANIEDTALKVVGKSCALQCKWTALQSDSYDVRAFLPKPDADGSKVANEGVFISIDGRPVSTSRGTPKKIVTAYKQQLRKTSLNLRSVKDAFLCMYITCPSGSYDPNIEPSKDDVLFEREDIVLDLITKLFTAHFPEVAVTIDASDDPEPQIPARRIQSQDVFSALDSDVSVINGAESNHSARPGTTFSILEEAAPSAETRRVIEAPPVWRSNMYGIDEEDLELINSDAQPPVIEDEEEGRRAANVSNPWTIAKMSASTKSKPLAVNSQLLTPAKSHGDFMMNSSSPVRMNPRQQLSLVPPTPRTISKAGVDSLPYDSRRQHDGEQSSPVRVLDCRIPSQSNAPIRNHLAVDNSTPAALLNIDFSSPLGTRRIERSKRITRDGPTPNAFERPPNHNRRHSRPMRGQGVFIPPRTKSSRRRPELDPRAFDCDEPVQVLTSNDNTDIRNFLGRGRTQPQRSTPYEPITTSPPSAVVRRPFRPPRIVNRNRMSHTANPDLVLPRSFPRASSAEPLQRVNRNNKPQNTSNNRENPNHIREPNAQSQHDPSTHSRPRALSVDSEPLPTIERPRARTSDLEMNTIFAVYTVPTPPQRNPQLPDRLPETSPVHRRPITRLQRRRSSRLPLEHIPPAYRLHNVVLPISTTPSRIAVEALRWENTTTSSASHAFGTKIPDQILRAWVLRFDTMLEHFDTQLDSEGVILTLERGISAALRKRQTEQADELVPSSDVQEGEVVQPGGEHYTNALDQIRNWAKGVSSSVEEERSDVVVSSLTQGIEPALPVGDGRVGDEYGGDDLDDEMLMDI